MASADLEQSGDATSTFQEIYDRYAARLYNHIYRFAEEHAQAEDLLQETFVKVYCHLDRLPNEPQRKGYLYRVAQNICIDWLRRRRPEYASTWTDGDESSGPVTPDDLITDSYCLREDLRRALRDVPLSLRVPLLLYAVDDLTYAEIAGVLDIQEEVTVRMRVSRARRQVRELYRRATEGAIAAESW
jgi:RNA polymerase sigma-70 factor (ECF subfamily)